MIINSIDNKCVLNISVIRNNGQSYNVDISLRLDDAETDTNIEFSTTTCLYLRDLQYILKCYQEISQEKSSFGFTSCDQTINFWVTGTDFIHKMILRDKRYNSDFASQCKLSFQIQSNLPLQLCDRIDNVPIGNLKKEFKTDNNDLFSICFPCLVEYVDIDLCVCKIDIKSSYYHITRKFDSSYSEIESLKEKIADFKSGRIQNFYILGDFLEINFLRFENSIDIQGEISDFTWPNPNEIKFHELVSMNILDQMHSSLETIWETIRKKEESRLGTE